MGIFQSSKPNPIEKDVNKMLKSFTRIEKSLKQQGAKLSLMEDMIHFQTNHYVYLNVENRKLNSELLTMKKKLTDLEAKNKTEKDKRRFKTIINLDNVPKIQSKPIQRLYIGKKLNSKIQI